MWKWNPLSLAFLRLYSLDVMSSFLCMWWSCAAWIYMCVHICVCARVNAELYHHPLPNLEIAEISIAALEFPPAGTSGSVKRINNVSLMFNYSLSSAAKALLTAQSGRPGLTWSPPASSLHVEPVISWSMFNVTTFISFAFCGPKSWTCTYLLSFLFFFQLLLGGWVGLLMFHQPSFSL